LTKIPEYQSCVTLQYVMSYIIDAETLVTFKKHLDA